MDLIFFSNDAVSVHITVHFPISSSAVIVTTIVYHLVQTKNICAIFIGLNVVCNSYVFREIQHRLVNIADEKPMSRIFFYFFYF